MTFQVAVGSEDTQVVPFAHVDLARALLSEGHTVQDRELLEAATASGKEDAVTDATGLLSGL